MSEYVENLEPGDYLYQPGLEIFLAVTENNENDIEFAVHGWRTIDKERLDTYLEEERPIIHTSSQVEEIVEEADDPEGEEKLAWLTEIFEQYRDVDIEEDSAHSDFALDDS